MKQNTGTVVAWCGALPALALASTLTPTAADSGPLGIVMLITTSAVDASAGAPVPATICAIPGMTFTAFPPPSVPLRRPASSATGLDTSVLSSGS